MGASAALAVGVAGCERKPKRKIISRVEGPEYQKPGRVLYYSSTWTEGPYPYGLLVRTVDGRPIKVEGNPDHPVNRGASLAAMQATILSLYDPDRLRTPVRNVAGGKQEPIDWRAADEQIVQAIRECEVCSAADAFDAWPLGTGACPAIPASVPAGSAPRARDGP